MLEKLLWADKTIFNDNAKHQQPRHFAAHLQSKNREPALQKSCKTYASASVRFFNGATESNHWATEQTPTPMPTTTHKQ